MVYAKPPFGGPEQVLKYLARYTHRVAITNRRLIALEEDEVRFHWKDYAQGGVQKTMTLPVLEFIRRFLMHVLPSGFVRIRHYGFLANRLCQEQLARCRALLGVVPTPEEEPSLNPAAPDARAAERAPGPLSGVRGGPHGDHRATRSDPDRLPGRGAASRSVSCSIRHEYRESDATHRGIRGHRAGDSGTPCRHGGKTGTKRGISRENVPAEQGVRDEKISALRWIRTHTRRNHELSASNASAEGPGLD